ncbi:hypothetical protein J6590_063608 [Homalodisca vitripennis]|nr:hypothetical protein J6590_063608 [Homalodisca vitripennis]
MKVSSYHRYSADRPTEMTFSSHSSERLCYNALPIRQYRTARDCSGSMRPIRPITPTEMTFSSPSSERLCYNALPIRQYRTARDCSGSMTPIRPITYSPTYESCYKHNHKNTPQTTTYQSDSIGLTIQWTRRQYPITYSPTYESCYRYSADRPTEMTFSSPRVRGFATTLYQSDSRLNVIAVIYDANTSDNV